jgi:tetratricopeptide (TPR) repeat protein
MNIPLNLASQTLRIVILLTLATLFALYTPDPVQAAEPEAAAPEPPDPKTQWQNLAVQYTLLMRVAQYEKAIAVAQQAVRHAEEHFGPEGLICAQSLNDLGVLYRHQNRHAEAVAAHRRALAIREQQLPATDAAVVQSQVNLAKELYYSHESQEAIPLLEKAYHTVIERLGEKSLRAAEIRFYLGAVNEVAGHWDQAEQHYGNALVTYAAALRSDDPRLVELVQFYARLLRTQKRQQEAEQLEHQYLPKDYQNIKSPEPQPRQGSPDA